MYYCFFSGRRTRSCGGSELNNGLPPFRSSRRGQNEPVLLQGANVAPPPPPNENNGPPPNNNVPAPNNNDPAPNNNAPPPNNNFALRVGENQQARQQGANNNVPAEVRREQGPEQQQGGADRGGRNDNQVARDFHDNNYVSIIITSIF